MAQMDCMFVPAELCHQVLGFSNVDLEVLLAPLPGQFSLFPIVPISDEANNCRVDRRSLQCREMEQEPHALAFNSLLLCILYCSCIHCSCAVVSEQWYQTRSDTHIDHLIGPSVCDQKTSTVGLFASVGLTLVLSLISTASVSELNIHCDCAELNQHHPHIYHHNCG